ncbi:ABC transporter substrate-binding protein [Halanaerocella petrolearia]
MSRKLSYLVVLLLLLVLVVGCSSQQATEMNNKIKVGITQIVKHPSLDAVKKGFVDELNKQGYKEGEDIVYDLQNAQGDMSTAQTIATNFAQDDLDMILAIATPTAQAVANAINDTPILISAVTDPKKAGLVDSYEQPGGNLTGTSDLTPVGKQLALFNKLNQDIKRVGIIYNSGESNSVFLADLAKKKAKELGLDLVEATITSSSEVYQAAQSLTGRVDAIYVPTDNTVVSAIQSVIKVANENNLPLITGESNSVEAGALATLGVDYYQLGRQTGKMAIKVLEEGKSPAKMAIQYAQETKLVVNRKAAKEMNLELPEELTKQAEKVIK